MARRLLVVLVCAAFFWGAILPVAEAQDAGQTVKISLLLQGSSTQEATQGDECRAADALGDPELAFGKQTFSLEHGTSITVKESPTGRFGCMFEFEAKLDGSASYRVFVGDEKIGTITATKIANLDFAIEISIGGSQGVQSGSSWRFPTPPTPAPTATEAPTPTAVPAPDLGAIPGKDTYLLGGTFVLFGTEGDDFFVSKGMCFGSGGYNDIGVGTQVVVRDETNSIIASGEFEPDPNATATECKFVFYIEVPDSKFYSISITHRGEMVYSKAELEEMGWLVELGMGL